MDPVTLGALIMGGTNMASTAMSMFGNSGGMTKGQIRDQRYMNHMAIEQSLRQEQFQKQLATHGIRMRSADAEAAGIHPLAALGMNPVGGAPVSMNFDASGGGRGPNNWDRAAAFTDRMGQDISRAVSSTATKEEKAYQAARLADIQASTKESQVRTALAEKQLAEMKSPALPMPLEQSYVDMDGARQDFLNPQAAASLMSDPIRMWAESFKRAFYNAQTKAFWQEWAKDGFLRKPYGRKEKK